MRKVLIGIGCFMVITVLNLFYFPLNEHNGSVNILATTLDQYIPFNQYFVIPYLSWYFVLYWVPLWLLFKDVRLFRRVLFSLCLGLLASYATYYFFQTMVPRPVVYEADIFSQLVRYIYSWDKPYNAFPSIHCLTSFIFYLAGYRVREYNLRVGRTIQCLSLAIIISTLLIKQHVILDVLGGLILGGLIYALAAKEMQLTTKLFRLIRF